MISKREQLDRRLVSLKKARSTYENGWRDIMRQVAPYRLDLNLTRGGRYGGQRRDYHILNNQPIRALRTLSAGLMASVTSPAKKWHRLTVTDPDLAEHKPVKIYLNRCQDVIDAAFHASNLYNELSAGVYPDLSAIGTTAMFEEEGAPGKPWFMAVPVGDFYLAVDYQKRPDTFFREFEMTVRQLYQKFVKAGGSDAKGESKFSVGVRDDYNRGNYEKCYTVRHAIYANEEYREGALGPQGMRYVSCWWERGRGDDALLHEGGYQEFPVLAPRWETVGNSAYGFGPGWYALGDCQMLQHHEESLLVLIDKIKDPPMAASDNVSHPSLVPGSVTYLPQGEQMFFRPAAEVPPQALAALENHIIRAERRVAETFYSHLWQLLVEDTRSNKTATEIEYSKQEAMLMLGPLLENLNNGLLEPLIMRTFYMLDRADKLPIPPPELQGAEVKVEFTSIMHTMQQATGLAPLRTLIAEIQQIGTIRPDVFDKLDVDAIVEDLQRITGARPDAVLSRDEVNKIRAARQEQEQAQQTGQAMAVAAKGLKDAGQTDVDNLKELAQVVSPAMAAQGGLGS